MLPAELVDHIFSFLREDISALKACSRTHPFLSRIAERYLYADILVETNDKLTVSELHKQLSTNSRILHYPHTLEIRAYYDFTHSPVVKRETLSIIRIIPRMANLTSLNFTASDAYGNYLFKEHGFLSAFRHCLQQSSVEQLCLRRFSDFPFSILDNAKNIKKLTLSDCSAKKEGISKSPLSLETLIIHGLHNPDLQFWAVGRVTNLTSLQLPNVEYHDDWIGLPELLAACSNSLRKLHVGESRPLNSYVCSSGPSFGDWDDDNRGHYPFTLSTHKRLEQLSISAFVRVVDQCAHDDMLIFHCSLPAMIHLVKTAPGIQDIIFRFAWDWADSDVHCLGRFDWSLLTLLLSDRSANYPRIRLCISGANECHPIASESILDALLENEALRDLVKRDLVVLKPELIKKPWELRDFLAF